MDSFESERYTLMKEKMKEELSEGLKLTAGLNAFFSSQIKFLLLVMEVYERLTSDEKVEIKDLIQFNKELYASVIPDNYEASFCNPAYAVTVFGEGLGRIFSVIAFEMRACIPAAFEEDCDGILIRAELLMEVLTSVKDALQEGKKPGEKELKEIIYWYVSDYFDVESEKRVAELVDEEKDFAARLIMESDLSGSDYLYRYGEYITENEIKMQQYMAGLPQEKIDRIAHTFSEGYRIGFVNTGKDLSKKRTVNIRYPLGMERVVKSAIGDFEKMGLKPVIYRAASSLFRRQNLSKVGYFGANPNKQYDYDHAFDEALLLDGQLVTRRTECLRAAFEEYREKAAVHGGPAVIEIFGEEPFVPEAKPENLKLNENHRALKVKQTCQEGIITNEYIKGEERSFTIIAFPSPAIGENFESIFDETLEINTLDYYLYQRLQQTIIDELDKGEKVYIKGRGENKTDLFVSLIKTDKPDTQTKFENCVADVNIPVGEVFTSPVLKGTTGILHVSRVFLNELEYRNLRVTFKDGMVTDYMCDNYKEPEKNREFFKENVMFGHETLPLGEFAIGTNTRAYSLGRRFNIEGRLPILIAEKTGPHFAIGDTCYSHAEDIGVFNPDGKEIVARDNEISLLRNTEPEKAYFNCHTDITLPYDEVGCIQVVDSQGRTRDIIRDGRFVLPALEELNTYL